MKSVGIAKFKSGLCRYLRLVRGGREIVVTDHGQPVARVVPFVEKPANAALAVIPARGSFADWNPRNTVHLEEDIVADLLRDREGR